MPSSYFPPDVIVEQIRRTPIANRYPPQMPVVVVGPARQIVVRSNAGVYDVASQFEAALPSLAPGALVDEATFDVILDAHNSSGRQLGLFRLSGADAQLSLDGLRVIVASDIELEYSILSVRNNNQMDSVLDDDRATAVPEGILLTDNQIDFLSRGASISGDSYILIDSPTSMTGRYKIYEMIPTGQHAHAVRVEKCNEDGVADLTKNFSIDHSHLPSAGSRFIYGFPATHELGGTQTNNLVTPGLGVGVKATVETFSAAEVVDLVTPAACVIPGPDSGDAVVFAPAAPGAGQDNTGRDTPRWITLFETLRIGHWMRFTGPMGGGSPVIRDFRVTAINTSDRSVTLHNPDNAGVGIPNYSLASGAPDVTEIKVLEVLKGEDDDVSAAGDFLTGSALNIPFNLEIRGARPGFVELMEDSPEMSDAVDTAVTMRRGVPYRNASALYDVVKRIDSNYTANVLVSYQAARQDLPLNGLIELYDVKSIEQSLGMIHPDNPIALMADMVSRSGLADGNRTFYALCTPDNTLLSYEEALDVLESNEVYYVVPATQDLAHISLFKAHVEVQSQPRNKHERVVLASTPIITYSRQIPLVDDDPYPQGTVNSLNKKEFSSATVDWSLCNPGDVLKIMSTNSQVTGIMLAEYRIQTVDISAQKVTVLTNIDDSYVGTAQYFRVDTYPYTKAQQAEDWRDYTASMKPAETGQPGRVMIIRPDIMEMTYTDKTGPFARDRDIIVPMYYGCAVFAGLSSALPPQQPMTNVPIPGINRLLHSNFYFKPSDLNTIAEGGNNILVQTTRYSAPYSRHQLMANMESILTREFSIVKLVDFCAKYIRNSLRPYVGNHNITDEFLTQLRGITESILRALVQTGVLLQGTTLDSLFQDPDQPDAVIIEVTCRVPYPCNLIHVKLYI